MTPAHALEHRRALDASRVLCGDRMPRATLLAAVAALLDPPYMRFAVSRLGLMFGSSRYLGAPLRGVAITLVALAGGALGAASASADNQTVQVTDFAFAPAAVAVKPGETVTWNFAGGTEAHNVTFEDGSLRYPPGEDHDLHPWSTSKTFAAPAAGMYRYFCDHHGSFGGVGMAGVVYVNAAGALPGTPPTATFSVSSSAVVGEPVTFNSAGSNDPDPMGSIIR